MLPNLSKFSYLLQWFTSLVLIAFLSTSAIAETTTPPETWELVKSEGDIEALQTRYDLIRVSATPTEAAFLPGWPEAVWVILVAMYAEFIAGEDFDSTFSSNRQLEESQHNPSPIAQLEHDWFGGLTTIIQIIISTISSVAWTVSFIIMILHQSTGGWISVVAWAFPMWLGFQLAKRKRLVSVIVLGFTILQYGGSLYSIVQRWRGIIGAVAYSITDLNGCSPHNGSIDFLVHGIRARAFRIMQTTNFVYATIFIPPLALTVFNEEDKKGRTSKYLVALYMSCGPVIFEIIYLGIIASKGQPAVISGNCLLIELSPRFGFFDSEISHWWKVLMALTGL